MFRNVEYVLALKDLMNLKGKQLTIEDYKEAFDKIDKDNSGYIETSEIRDLFRDAYGGQDEDIPPYEIRAFLEFFDQNEDGKVSWEEFEKGLMTSATKSRKTKKNFANALLASIEERQQGGDDVDDEAIDVQTDVSGTIEIEMDDGKIVQVDAKKYMKDLKEEAQKLKVALRQEKFGGQGTQSENNDPIAGMLQNTAGAGEDGVDIAGYIASRQGDVKKLTEDIKPEIVETMKKLVNFVLDGGDSGRTRSREPLTEQQKAEMEMEIPGSALQQLALWQLVLGYRLREEEAKGDYVNLLNW